MESCKAFENVTCNHVYKELNEQEDKLSKEPLLLIKGSLTIIETNESGYFYAMTTFLI